MARALELAGGRRAVVAVLPQASAEPDAGDDSVAMWKEAGAEDAVKVSFDDRAAAARTLRLATLIWMPGGDQNRFMTAITGTGLDDLIGRSSVVVIDARHADVDPTPAGQLVSGRGIQVTILHAGQHYRLR